MEDTNIHRFEQKVQSHYPPTYPSSDRRAHAETSPQTPNFQYFRYVSLLDFDYLWIGEFLKQVFVPQESRLSLVRRQY